MLELIEDLSRSLKNGDTDFYTRIVKGYIKLTGTDYGLLFSSDDSGNPYLLCSAMSVDHKTSELTEYYLKNYKLLFRELSETNNNSSFIYRSESSSLFFLFKCSFNGIMVLVSDSGTFNPDASLQFQSLTGIIENFIDIFREKCNSEVIIKEKHEESLRKTRYLSELTNELRTPINAISGFAQLLKEPDLKPENISKYICIISDTSENIIAKISSYSEIAELEAGRIRIFKNIIILSEFLDEVYSIYSRRFSMKDLSLELRNLIDRNKTRVYGDDVKIKQILDILLSNAFNNTFSGKIILSSRLCGEFIEFCVSDTGSGLDTEIVENIFDYKGGQSSLISNLKGSGLGLLIAKSYVGLMGGKIWCRSEAGKGSEFYFTLPYSPVPELENDLKKPSGNELRKIDTERKKVLVAEDDNLNFQLISNFLSKLDLEVIRAENGKEAVDIFKSDSIDLILMDIRMPVMDGYTAARLIREISPDVKIIAQTAYSNDKSIAVSNGCNDFIAKPFSRNQLVSMVTAYL